MYIFDLSYCNISPGEAKRISGIPFIKYDEQEFRRVCAGVTLISSMSNLAGGLVRMSKIFTTILCAIMYKFRA